MYKFGCCTFFLTLNSYCTVTFLPHQAEKMTEGATAGDRDTVSVSCIV